MLVCGSGVGVAIVANKVDGVRAVNAHDADEAEMARRHNDANVLTLSGARLAPDAADAIVATFLRRRVRGRPPRPPRRSDRRSSSRLDERRRDAVLPSVPSRRMTDLPPDFFNRPLAEVDPEIATCSRTSSSASSGRWR